MSVPPEYGQLRTFPQRRSEDTLADILERVLDKGIVIAGDIMVNVMDIELLTLKVRLVVASVDTARDMGIDWWTSDPFLTGGDSGEQRQHELEERIEQLEQRLRRHDELPEGAHGSDGEHAPERGTDHGI